MILFVAKVYAPEAVLAAFAVVAKIAVRAVQAIAAEVAVIAFLHVDALVAELGFFGKCAICGVAAKAHPEAIITVFGPHVAYKAITVFPCGMVGTVI